ncbi:MAG: ABC transporter substrate-binding protein [bacterium]
MCRRLFVLVATILVVSVLGGWYAAGLTKLTAVLQSQTSDFKSLEPLLKKYSQENPDVDVEIIGQTAADFANFLITGWEAGSDKVDFMQGGPLGTFVEAGYIIPLDGSYDPEIKLPADLRADMFDSSIELGTYKGKLWIVYYSTDANPFFYRKDLFEKAGFPGPPRDYSELINYGKKLTVDKDGDGVIDQWGFSWWLKPQTNSNAMWFYNTLYGEGGQLITEDLELKFNSPAGERAMQFMYDLIHTHKISPEASLAWYQNELYNAFRNGQVAMQQAGVWVYTPLNFDAESPVKGKVGVAPFPKGSVRQGVQLGGNGFYIASNSKHKKEAWKAILYLLNTESQVFMSKMGLDYSARKSIYFNPEVRARSEELYETYYKLLESAYSWPKFAGSERVEETIAKHLDRALHKLATTKQALADAEREIKRNVPGIK